VPCEQKISTEGLLRTPNWTGNQPKKTEAGRSLLVRWKSAQTKTHPPQKKNRDPTEGEAEAILKSKSRCEENKTDASGRNRGNKYMRKEKRRSDLTKLTKGKMGSIKK
jgi:hypothetical protein